MFRQKATMFAWLALLLGVVVSKASAQQNNKLTLVPAQAQVMQNGQVQIDVFVENVTGLRAYEVWLEITGGSGGTLTAVDVSVNTGRNDYVFFGDANDYCGTQTSQLLAACASGIEAGVDVGTTPEYLATYVFAASAGASGMFNIGFTSSTVLIDSDFNEIAPLTLDGATVTVVDPSIPTVSEWGLIVMLLLMLAAGTLILNRRGGYQT